MSKILQDAIDDYEGKHKSSRSIHTPTPWKVAELYGGEDYVIRCDKGSDRKVGYSFTLMDAAHIVHCVNEREGLLNILKRLIDLNEETDSGIASWAPIWDKAKKVLADSCRQVPS